MAIPLTAAGGQGRARRANPRARVDLLLPVVGDVFYEASEMRVGMHDGSWKVVAAYVGRGRLLHQQLAAEQQQAKIQTILLHPHYPLIHSSK